MQSQSSQSSVAGSNRVCSVTTQKVQKKGASSRMQSVCDEDTQRVEPNYKETQNQTEVFLAASRQVSPEFTSPHLASNYTVWLVSLLALNPRRKTRDVLAPNEKEKSSWTATGANRTP